MVTYIFYFNDPATTQIYTLSLHDALPILPVPHQGHGLTRRQVPPVRRPVGHDCLFRLLRVVRSEEHTSELQSPVHLVCRLLLEKKKERTKLVVPAKAVFMCTTQTPRLQPI